MLTKFVFSGCTAFACNSNISRFGKIVPQLHVTWPCPTRGILVGLVLELTRPLPEVNPDILDVTEAEVGVLTGTTPAVCCWANCRAAAAAAAMAGGNGRFPFIMRLGFNMPVSPAKLKSGAPPPTLFWIGGNFGLPIGRGGGAFDWVLTPERCEM